MPIYYAETEFGILQIEAESDEDAIKLAPTGTFRLYPEDDFDYLIIDDDLP